MQHGLKESKITDWWVAPICKELEFVNILSEDAVEGELIVVGYPKSGRNPMELWTSSNQVIKITEDGVITAQGSFYPFEEAHPVYLSFLIEANNKNTILAYRWSYVNNLNKRKVIANLVEANGVRRENATFDIIPDKKSPVLTSGYSEELACNVAFSSFNKRGFCLRIGMPKEVKAEIYRSSFATPTETKARVQKVKEIFKNNTRGECICVIS